MTEMSSSPQDIPTISDDDATEAADKKPAVKHSEMFSNARKTSSATGPVQYYTPQWSLAYLDDIMDKLRALGMTKIWECCAGPPGRRNIASYYQERGWDVTATDVDDTTPRDFYTWSPPSDTWDLIVTNPPFSAKSNTVQRAYDLIMMNGAQNRGFILLLPTISLDSSTIRAMIKRYDTPTHKFTLLVPPKTIDYELVDKSKKSRSFFHSSFFMFLPRSVGLEQNMILL